MFVEFGTAWARSFDADTGAKDAEVSEVWGPSIPCFEWCAHGATVDATVVQVGCVGEGSRPVSRRETGAVEEGSGSDREGVIPLLRAAILRGAVGTRRFNHIHVGVEESGSEGG